jgi:hypothetical protein
LASEKDLEAYQRLAVERPTTHIISHLQQIEEARRELNWSGGIILENHANTSAKATKRSSKVCRIYAFQAKDKPQARVQNRETPIRLVYTY